MEFAFIFFALSIVFIGLPSCAIDVSPPQSVDAAAFARLSKGIVLKPELLAAMIAATAALLDSAPTASAAAASVQTAASVSAAAFAYLQALAATDRLALNVRFLDATDTASLRATLARLDAAGYTTALVCAAFGV